MSVASKLKCVSLFSGCGGLDLGLERAGFRVVLANDNEELCGKSAAANFPSTPFHVGSVSDMNAKLMAKLSKETKTGIDLLAGGPPCPPYSKSRFYRKEKPRGLDDPTGWETMQGYLNVLKVLKPRAFLLENVAGLAYKVHKEAFDLILNTAEGLGYSISHAVLNAADYGVPQIRERLFVVGMKEGKFTFPPPTHAKPAADASDLFAGAVPPWVTAGDVLKDLDTDANASDDGHYAGGQHNELLKLIPPGDNYLFFTKERGHPDPLFRWRSRYWSFLLKLSPAMPAWTIQARRSNNMGPFHWRNRILRIAEIKRIQTFPDDWVLAGNTDQQWRQVGNAVPPLLAQRLGEAIAAQLKKEASRARRKRAASAIL